MSNTPKVIDLYSGVGGLSLGAVKSGFNLVGAVEYEKRILDSHAVNFPQTIHICSDVSSLNGKALSAAVKLRKSELAGLIGGPPCQGFSTMGKRSLADTRNNLFIDFFRLTSEVQPAFFLAENVPGILDKKYIGIRESAIKIVEKKYQVLEPIRIAANDYGAATTRTRIFFIGIRKDVAGAELLTQAIESMKSAKHTYVGEALVGLPVDISEDWMDYASSWRKIFTPLFNNYAKELNRIHDGVGDSSSVNRFLKKKEVSGCFGTKHSNDVAVRYSNLSPGQQDRISKAARLNSNGFCPTLRAGTDCTRGSFQAVRPIHPTKGRVITPREAARLQGFPDWFQFHQTKWHSFRQIGNSVCPIVAEKVLTAIKQTISI